MQLNTFVERLRRFDAYPKTLEDFRVKTFGGATGNSAFYVLSVFSDKLYFGYLLNKPEHLTNIVKYRSRSALKSHAFAMCDLIVICLSLTWCI